MLRQRLVARIGHSKHLGHARLADHRLTFHKRSNDGSGKCTVINRSDSDTASSVWGVLFELSARQKSILGNYEGTGYEEREIVITHGQNAVNAFTYVSLQDWTDSSSLPYSWYKSLVLAGAVQSGLPQTYIADIERVSSTQDPDAERISLHNALIDDSGYGHLIS